MAFIDDIKGFFVNLRSEYNNKDTVSDACH